MSFGYDCWKFFRIEMCYMLCVYLVEIFGHREIGWVWCLCIRKNGSVSFLLFLGDPVAATYLFSLIGVLLVIDCFVIRI